MPNLVVMLLPQSPPLTDAADLRFRMATLKAGVWLGLGMIAAGLAYFALTWDEGNRPLLAATGVAIAVTDLGMLLLPMQRIVAGRWREPFFLGWTLSNVAALLLLGGTGPHRAEPADPAADDADALRGHVLPAGLRPDLPARRWSSATAPRRSSSDGSSPSARSSSWSCCGRLGCACGRRSNRERQHDELERQRDELARVSLTDPLTDALNRRGFEDRLRREMADSARSERPLMLAVLDLDDFKAVNDRQGHGAGDALLRETVERLSGVLRPLDVVGRLGGDEFAVLFPGAGPADAESLVGRLRDALAGRVPASFGYTLLPGRRHPSRGAVQARRHPPLHRQGQAAAPAGGQGTRGGLGHRPGRRNARLRAGSGRTT